MRKSWAHQQERATAAKFGETSYGTLAHCWYGTGPRYCPAGIDKKIDSHSPYCH